MATPYGTHEGRTPRKISIRAGQTAQATVTDTTISPGRARYLWATTRIALGWVFLWAFLDKLFGFGFATARESAWINGGSPTFGFLTFGTAGPFADVFQAIAGNVLVDWLFMMGLVGVGVALVTGIGMRLASYAGATMLVLMYLAAMPPANNPIIDDHLIYALVLLALPLARAGETWGLGRWWKQQPLVREHTWLE